MSLDQITARWATIPSHNPTKRDVQFLLDALTQSEKDKQGLQQIISKLKKELDSLKKPVTPNAG